MYTVKANNSLLVWKQHSREYNVLRREYSRRVYMCNENTP